MSVGIVEGNLRHYVSDLFPSNVAATNLSKTSVHVYVNGFTSQVLATTAGFTGLADKMPAAMSEGNLGMYYFSLCFRPS